MAKGNKVVPVRIDNLLLGIMKYEINLANRYRRGQPFDMSSFIRQAIIDKINHRERSRKKPHFLIKGRREEVGD